MEAAIEAYLNKKKNLLFEIALKRNNHTFMEKKFSVKLFNKIAMERCASVEQKATEVIFVLVQIIEVRKW
jgi:hypothetical protein